MIPGYYYALSDNLKYEAEDAREIGVSIKHLNVGVWKEKVRGLQNIQRPIPSI